MTLFSKANLKQQRKTARVFFSSPFGGLEEEREELTKKYWPQLSSMCKKAGYEFVPVDMRWGITSEMSSNAATIEICLREMDRSDMIVGFFGQVTVWYRVENYTEISSERIYAYPNQWCVSQSSRRAFGARKQLSVIPLNLQTVGCFSYKLT